MPPKNTGESQPAGKKAQASRVKGVNRMVKQDAGRKAKSTAVKGRGGNKSTRGY